MKKLLGLATTASTVGVALLMAHSAFADPPSPPVCGNSVMEAPETCDDGNIMSGDGCSALCQMEPMTCPTSMCGDGTVSPGEECDDENSLGGDGCSSSCMAEGIASPLIAVCGDGLVSDGEMCDDGNTVGGDDCSATCDAATPPIIFCNCLCRTPNRTVLCANSNPGNDPMIRCIERGFGPNNPRTEQACRDAEGSSCQGYVRGTGTRVIRGATLADCRPVTTNP